MDWTEVVWNYSQAGLTYESARLPALSGIASRQQAVTGGQYFAGLWKKDLSTMLLWRIRWTRRANGLYGVRRRGYGFQSVAEHTFRTATEPEIPLEKVYIKVLEARTRLAGPDPFGAVIGGELVLACSCLIRGKLMVEDGKSAWRVQTSTELVDVWPDLLETVSTQSDGATFLLPFCLEGLGGIVDPETGRQILVPDIRGLALQPCAAHKGRFMRAGFFRLEGYYKSRGLAIDERFLNSLYVGGKSTMEADVPAKFPLQK